MSRPQAPPEAFSSSLPCPSSLMDPVCSSSLRARLRSPDPVPPEAPSASPRGLSPAAEVYQRFRACFAVDPGDPQSKGGKGDEGDDALAQLREAFADAGLRLYTSIAQEIVQAHGDIDASIEALSAESSAVVSRADALYANVSYPLSATLCHAGNLPSATIAAHLSSLGGRLSAAHDELRGLQSEWEACLEEEEQLWAELGGPGADGGLLNGSDAHVVEQELKRFRDEVDEALEEHEGQLDAIDADFRRSVHVSMVQSMKMMVE